jgi:hypothetical protein
LENNKTNNNNNINNNDDKDVFLLVWLLLYYIILYRPKVLENRVLRRIFGPKRGEMVGGWRKLHKEELHNAYCLPNVIRMTKSRRMRWVGHVESMRRGGEEFI